LNIVTPLLTLYAHVPLLLNSRIACTTPLHTAAPHQTGPHEETVGEIREFQKLFLAPGFLAYSGVLIAVALVIIFYFAPKYVCTPQIIGEIYLTMNMKISHLRDAQVRQEEHALVHLRV
jgi:hypothetical protein